MADTLLDITVNPGEEQPMVSGVLDSDYSLAPHHQLHFFLFFLPAAWLSFHFVPLLCDVWGMCVATRRN